MIRVYVAGPMRGIPHYNYPAFDKARDELLERGFGVVSPADMDRQCGFDAMELPADSDWSDYPAGMCEGDVVRRCVNALLTCEMIYMLPGWRFSKGATAERAVALWRDMEVAYAPWPILDEARQVVYGRGEEQYGHPRDDFQRTATLFWAQTGIVLTAEQVAMFMMCVKLSRQVNRPQRDNLVDLAGYAECLSRLSER